MEERSDAALMELTARGDTVAFRALYDRYENRIFNFVLRMTGQRELAQDMIQEAFTRLWSTAHMFDPRRGTLKAWLYKMALNIVHSEMRKKMYGQRFEPLDDRNAVQDATGDPAPSDEKQRDILRLRRAVASLPPPFREVMVMRCYQELMFREIAEITGTPEGTVKARFHRAVAQLKRTYGPEWETT